MFWHFRPYAIENTNPFALTYMSRLFTHTSSPGGGGNSWKLLVGVCRPVLQILTLFQTQKYHFPHPFSDLASKIHTPSLWYLNKKPTNPFWVNFLQSTQFFYVNVLHVTIRSRKVMQITYLHDQTVDVSSGRAVWNIDMYQSCCNTRLCCKYVTSSNAVTYLHILRYCVDDYVHVLLISLKWKQPFLLQNVTFVAVKIYDGYDSLICGYSDFTSLNCDILL